ncbi:MAG: YceI family protein [Galactobacter sp.]
MSSPAELNGNWNLDAAHANIGFTIRHAGVSKVHGTFTDFSGQAASTDGAVSAEVEIKTASINTRNEGRDGHLQSADFFDAEQFPTITFKTTAVEIDGEDATVTGDLTIKGITKSVELKGEFNGTATDPFGAHRTGFSLEGSIKRADYDLTWNAALETGGFMLGDKVKLNIEAEFVKA